MKFIQESLLYQKSVALDPQAVTPFTYNSMQQRLHFKWIWSRVFLSSSFSLLQRLLPRGLQQREQAPSFNQFPHESLGEGQRLVLHQHLHTPLRMEIPFLKSCGKKLRGWYPNQLIQPQSADVTTIKASQPLSALRCSNGTVIFFRLRGGP